MDIISTRSRQPVDRYLRRILSEILEVPRTPLAAYLCRELQKSLEIKHAQQDFDAIRARIRANRRHIAMVNRKLNKRLRSGQDVPCHPHPHFLQSTRKASHNRPVANTKIIIKEETSETETESLSTIPPHLEGTEGQHNIMASKNTKQGQLHRCSADVAVAVPVAVALASSTHHQSSTAPVDSRVRAKTKGDESCCHEGDARV